MLTTALENILILFGTAVAIIAISNRLRIPSIIAFLLTGMASGPHGLGLISEESQIRVFSDLGVVFLLFLVGLEFSADRLKKLRRIVLVGGNIQTAILIFIPLAFVPFAEISIAFALATGFVLVQSSTTVVMKIYGDRHELDTPHADIVLGVSLFQDISIVPLLLLLPLISGSGVAAASPQTFAMNLGILVVVLIAANKLLSRIMQFIAETRIRELFILSSLVLCLGAALLTSKLGFSMAMGAFLCGILLSSCDYHYQISSETAPFRDVFNSLFFISIGMMIETGFLLRNLHFILPIVLVITFVKFGGAYIAVAALRYPSRIRIISGIGLSNIGEFAFVLLQAAAGYGLIASHEYQLFSSIAVLSIMIAPILILAAPRIAEKVSTSPPASEQKLQNNTRKQTVQVLIIGFGLAGKHLAKVLKEAGISYRVLELDAIVVRDAKLHDEPIIYGDAIRSDILKAVGMSEALIAAYLISDDSAMRQSIRHARAINKSIFIIARTRRFSEIDNILKTGADEVVAEEFETSIELFTIVLTRLHVPRNMIRSQTKILRQDGYEMLRVQGNSKGISEKVMAALAAGTTDTFYVSNNHFAANKTLHNLNLRYFAGASVIAIVRDEKSMPNPPSDLPIESGDVLVLVGNHAQIDAAFDYLETGDSKRQPQT